MIGTKIIINNVEWEKNEKSLVLVLQKDCHYCTESADFYKRLSLMIQRRNKTKLIASFPTPISESKRYLETIGLNTIEVVQSGIQELKVRGTPTILLVDKHGLIVRMWRGKLSKEKEIEVLGVV